MIERKAVHYGQLELIPGITCDAYVLDDDTPVMSERGAADLLGMKQASLQNMANNGLPKILKPFVDEGWTFQTHLVKVTAKDSPYKGRNIVAYSSDTIETFIHAYALALVNEALRTNQQHIGDRKSVV